MRTASVAELKARLSEFIATARRGEDVIVTDRGKPVARLSALVGDEHLGERLERAIREGVIRPPRAKLPEDFRERVRARDPEGRSLEIVREEREVGW